MGVAASAFWIAKPTLTLQKEEKKGEGRGGAGKHNGWRLSLPLAPFKDLGERGRGERRGKMKQETYPVCTREP